MLKPLQDAALGGYALLVRSGLTRVPLVRKSFLSLYKFYKYNFEAGPIDSLNKFVRPGDLVIDVGANIGVFTLCFARWVGPQGEVIAIEPEDLNFSTMQSEVARSGFNDRVTAVNAVCVEEPGERRLARNDVHPGDHKLALEGDGAPVQAVSIDQLLETRPNKRVSLIKIDVQGAEVMVLQGALATLQKHSPALFVEIHEEGLAHFGTSSAELIQLLKGFGYTLNRLETQGRVTRQSEEELAADVKLKGYVDTLFLPPNNWSR